MTTELDHAELLQAARIIMQVIHRIDDPLRKQLQMAHEMIFWCISHPESDVKIRARLQLAAGTITNILKLLDAIPDAIVTRPPAKDGA